MTRHDFGLIASLAGGWAATAWKDFIQPGLQGVLLLLTVLAAYWLLKNRIEVSKNNRLDRELKELQIKQARAAIEDVH